MIDVTIRPARAADLDALLALYRELAGDRREAAPCDGDGARRLLETVGSDRSRHLMVATVDRRVLGTADMLVVVNVTHHGKPWAIVENVVVARTARRSGVGRALMSQLIEMASAAGCYKLQLLSGSLRVEAHSFYRSLGFEQLAEGFRLYLDE